MSNSAFYFYFVILTFSLLTASIQPYIIMCKDCREQSQEYCVIRNSTGYSILPYHHVLSESQTFISVIDDLSDCIPPDLIVKERNFTVLCVWSPALGCQMLVDYAIRATACLECRVDTLEDGIPRCPCEKMPVIAKALGSGSGHIDRGTLQVMVLAIISFFLIRKLCTFYPVIPMVAS